MPSLHSPTFLFRLASWRFTARLQVPPNYHWLATGSTESSWFQVAAWSHIIREQVGYSQPFNSHSILLIGIPFLSFWWTFWVFRTFKLIEAVLYWEGLRRAVKDYVAQCAMYQASKYQTRSPAGLLQPLPIPMQVWSDISIDFVEGLPKSHG